MREEVRKILDEIEQVLLRRDEVSQDLWNILTALRGPDSDSSNVKIQSTCFIRRAAFPNIGTTGVGGAIFYPRAWGGSQGTMATSFEALRESNPKETIHFGNHYRLAAKSLGLIDDGVMEEFFRPVANVPPPTILPDVG